MGGVEFYFAALIMGLAGSLHCLGMCGPIFLTTASFYAKPSDYFTPVVLHHIGKIIAYVCLGLLMGFLGSGISLLWFQNQVMIYFGLLLLIFSTMGFFNWQILKGLNHFIMRKMGDLLAKKGKGMLLVGIINGFIPCGLVYAAAIGAAATQNIGKGMVFMLLFGIGTMPLLTAVGFSKWIFGKIHFKNSRLWKQIPMFILGLWLMLKGLGLGIPYISPDLKSHNPEKNCCENHANKH